MKQGILRLKPEELSRLGTEGVTDLIKTMMGDKPFSFEAKPDPKTPDYLILVTTD